MNTKSILGWAFALVVLLMLLAFLFLAGKASAQTVAGDRFTLNTGPCTIRSGAGPPEGAVTGKVCDVYLRIDGGAIGVVYVKETGTGNTGWSTLTPGIPLDPTPGKVLASGSPVTWTPTPSLTGITGAGDLTLNPAASLRLTPSGNVITNPGGRSILPALPFTTTIGALSNKYLALHAAELWVETLVAQQTLATIGGRVVVAPTNVLARDVAPGDAVIYVKYNSFQLHESGIELGSKLFLESAGKFEAMSVVNTTAPAPEPDGSYAYAVQRDNDGTGANQWYAGDAILDTGKWRTASGFLDLYATRGLVRGTGPTIVGNVRTQAEYNGIAPRFALGNLNGVGYGHTSDIYGFAAGDPNGPNLFVDPVNGLNLRHGSTPFVAILPNGGAYFAGDGNGVTNINGGNIRADTITGDQIAANSITVADLNATGFGDNVIKNGTFEASAGKAMGDPSALAGWSKDLSSSTAPIQNQCCGTTGPGTLLLDSGDGAYIAVVYLATPVEGGQVYRVAGKVYADRASNPAMHIGVYESTSQAAGVRYVHHAATPQSPPDIPHTGQTFLAINAPVQGGWQSFEFTYTVPQGSRWASIFLVNESGTVSGSPYTRLYFDDIEMQRQIGPGHIRASAITADKIAAGAITADKIAAGVITSDKIASGSASNFLRNSECRTGTSDWTPQWSTPMIFSWNYAPSWALLGEPSVCYVEYPNTLAPGHYSQIISKSYPAMPGKRYETSAYLGAHRDQVRTIIQFLDAGGNNAGFTYGPICPPANSGGQYLSGYCRSGVLMDAPANAVAVRMLVETYYDDSSVHPFTFFVRAFLGEAKPSQTELSEWSPAGLTEINGGLITTGAIQAQHIAAGAVTAGKVAAGSITATEIAGRTITADRIGVGVLTSTEIAARSLSADRIAVGALTSTEIAARSITADRIVGGAITGTEIAGNTISGGHIAGNTITGGNIAGNTITGDKITAGAITADKIAADAINGKTITGVTIYGSTIYAGSGNQVTLDGSGISIAQGGATENKLKWSGGGSIWSNSNTIQLETQQGHFTGHLEVSGYIFAGAAFPGGGGEYVMYNAGCGCFARYASSVRYKDNVRPWTAIDPLAILRVPLVRYDYKMPTNAPPGFTPDRDVIGLLVEDLIKVAPDAVILDALGRPDALRGGALDIYLIAALKAEDARIAELERRLKAAEAALQRIGGGS